MLTINDVSSGAVQHALLGYGLSVQLHGADAELPGSFWGAPEAGLVADNLHVRGDTPVHSALHESAHFICMAPARRTQLHTDAGGDDDEESAVCYLQILLAQQRLGLDPQALMGDMDTWGYSFRLGSALAWFAGDADDALEWLVHFDIVSPSADITGRLRAR